MRMSKKILALLLSVLFVAAAFAGCSGSQNNAEDVNAAAEMICTPKVRHFRRGAYFYGKNRKKEQSI